MRKDAAKLRQRAAWVRELEAELQTSIDEGNVFAGVCLVQIKRLTGPIPAAEPCAGCLPAEGGYGDGPPPMVMGRHVEGCNGTAPTKRKEP